MRRLLLVAVLALAGCHSSSVSPYDPPSEASRETNVAEKLNREAADLITTDPTKAEAILREALTKDLFFGPAHNNLGVLFLNRGALYEAANEFEWARKLMAGSPDPRVNLAITMERAGRSAEAFRGYEAALEVASEYMPAIQGAASLAVRTHRDEPRLAGWLDRIALESEKPAWREWARARQSHRDEQRH